MKHRRRPLAEKAGVGTLGSAISKHDASCNTMDTALAAATAHVVWTLNAGEIRSAAAASRTAWPQSLITSPLTADNILCTHVAVHIPNDFPNIPIPFQEIFFPGTGKIFGTQGNSGPVNIPNQNHNTVYIAL